MNITFVILLLLDYRKDVASMGKEDIVEKLKNICDEYSDIIGRVILFGSYSRGEENSDSDIDLYIEPVSIEMTTAKLGANKRYKEFKYALYERFSTEFDLLAYGGKRDIESMKRSPLWQQISKDGIVIYDQGTKTV